MWRTISSKTIFKHPRITLVEDVVQLPDGSKVSYLKYADKNNAALVLCVQDGEVLLQQEYSYPTDEVLYQLPGGKVEADETPSSAAIRELKEEAGLQALKLKQLGWFYVDNRRTNAKMYVFLAEGVTEIQKQGGDPEENITSHWLSVNEITALITSGNIRNYSLLAAWSLYMSSLSHVTDI